jgi:ribosomal protein L33
MVTLMGNNKCPDCQGGVLVLNPDLTTLECTMCGHREYIGATNSKDDIEKRRARKLEFLRRFVNLQLYG